MVGSGGSVVSTVRTSSGVFIMGSDREDPVIQVSASRVLAYSAET